MGIRCDQFVGLPPAADVFLDLNTDPAEICEHCEQVIPCKLETIGYYDGMFGEEYPLVRYVLKDGRTADVFHQAAPWCAGPVHHLGLRVSDGIEFVWTEEEIESNLL